MPENKDHKRLIRARMQKTGESYTAARAQLDRLTLPADHEAIAGMSDEAVRTKTGHTWPHWLRRLDAAGATGMRHRDVARYLATEHGVPGWWAQTITVGYERLRGLREVHQRRGGSFDANKSRTFPVPVVTLYDAFARGARRAVWLDAPELTPRTFARPRSVRFAAGDGSRVQAWFTAKSAAKSSVQVQQSGLASRAAVDAAKARWHARLDALGAFLRGGV